MPEHEPSRDRAERTTVVHRVEISYRSIVAVALTMAGIWLLNLLLPIVVVIVVALILVGTLNPPIGWLQRHRLNRSLSIAIVFLACGIALAGIGLITIPALIAQVSQVIGHLPETQKSVARMLESHHLTEPLANTIRTFKPADRVSGLNITAALSASVGVVEVVGYIATSVVLAIYFIADGERTRGVLYALFPRRFHVRLARVLMNLETIVGGYLRGQIITSVAIGIFTFALLEITRVPNALALAAFAGLTDVIPFVGGLLATTPAVLVALSRGSAVTTIVLVAMLGYQEFESRVIVPRVYGQALRLSSAVVVIALLVGGKLGGVIGALLALPVAAALRMLIEELRVDMPGDDTDDPGLRARDARAERTYARETAGASPEEAAAVATEIATQIREADVAAGKDPADTPLNQRKR
ncbi:MAG TPA: AI-2E family transporter [Polyangia bacterium]|nr:AI-2E family transporter [Polyangia bacterium]